VAAQAPSGTVTFLFTDIEGSTRRWEQNAEVMGADVARHDELIRAAVDHHEGVVFATGGDGFAVAFARAGDALGCAVEVQQSLRAAGLPGVRMGVHTGEAEERDGNYFGSAVNRAARLMAIGHGGQVLVSLATRQLASAVKLRDLGEHRLRDLAEPEHVYQLLVSGVAVDFPRLRSLNARVTNLPVQLTSFVGREGDVQRVGELARDHRLVTLTGLGGVGKTRLALEAATRLVDGYDAVLLVDLAPIADPDLVVSATAGVLRMHLGETVADVSSIVHVLQTRRTLLVLDNCEHLLDPVAELAGVIAARCEECDVIATSREPLGVDGERVWRVPSMELNTAIALFGDRARAARSDFAIGASEGPAIEEICVRLDGIPLALELAAARVDHLTVQEIASLLGDRFRLLSGGRRRARQRQQTLQATMDWSYALLPPDERAMLRCCGVFVGGFTLDGLSGVSGEPLSSSLDYLAALVSKSLVVVDRRDDESSRYRLLETVRQYALERAVDVGEASSLRGRHARWFANLLREPQPLREQSLRGPVPASVTTVTRTQPPAAADRFDVELPNLLAALDWLDEENDLAELGRAAARLTRVVRPTLVWADDAHRYLHRVDVEGALQGQDLAAYAVANALNANSLGDFATQLNEARRAYELAVPDSDIRLIAGDILVNALAVFDPEEGLAIARQAIAELTPQTEGLRPILLTGMADCYITSGRLEEGVEVTRQRRRLLIARGQAPMGHAHLALVLHVLGRNDQARSELDSEPRDFAIDSHYQCLGEAFLAAANGRHEEARAHLLDAARAARSTPFRLIDRDLLVAAAGLAYLRGDPHRACILFAVERDSLFTRSPATWALYKHYRDQTRDALTREELDLCKAEARALTVDRALKEELGDVWQPTPTPPTISESEVGRTAQQSAAPTNENLS
jgi:predicted ATPase/class 3 adenylate cyclase